MEFKKYERKEMAELRPVTQEDIEEFIENGEISTNNIVISISQVDEDMGSPKIGDMIARNPKNHNDQWLVAKEYFEANFRKHRNGEN